MRMLSVDASLAWLTLVFAGGAGAQNTSPPDKPESSDGRTQTPETKGRKQPQGWTGPTDQESAVRQRRAAGTKRNLKLPPQIYVNLHT